MNHIFQISLPILAKSAHPSKVYPSQQSLPISTKSPHLSKVYPSQQSLPITTESTHLRKAYRSQAKVSKLKILSKSSKLKHLS